MGDPGIRSFNPNMNGFLVIKTCHHITVDIVLAPYHNILILFPIYFVVFCSNAVKSQVIRSRRFVAVKSRVDSCFRFGVVVGSTMERTKNVCPDDPSQVWIWKTNLSNSDNGRNRLPNGQVEKFRKQAI